MQINMKTMKPQRLTILLASLLVSLVTCGQLFRPLGLGEEKCNIYGESFFRPQLHVEGDILYACTNRGLYSKDLSRDDSAWQLVGFEGVPLQDYARKGDDILAMSFKYGEGFLLLSHDGGQTYKDCTPDNMRRNQFTVPLNLDRHPSDPNTLLISTALLGSGIFRTVDFGRTWDKLTSYTPNYMGFHPLDPEIIYECGGGGDYTDEETDFRISYDGGLTWEDKSSCFPNYSSVFHMAFHPTNPNRWIAGDYWGVHITDDNGHTWNTQHFSGNYTPEDYESLIEWRYASFDNENPDIVYMAGGHHNEYMKLICSTDGGKTWNRPYLEPIKASPTESVFDMKQYGDMLLIYSQSDVYEVSKAELIAATSPTEPVTFFKDQMATIVLPTEPDASKGKYYRLAGCKEGEIVFEQELQPRAHVPYIIVPHEDFSIDPAELELAGLTGDTVSVEGVRFIGTYVSEVLPSLGGDGGGFYYDIIDQTPDCSLSLSGETGMQAVVGALRAYLLVDWKTTGWNDPYTQGGTKDPWQKMEIVLKDERTGMDSHNDIKNEELRIKNDRGIYDLHGRRVSGSKLPRGIYIKDGRKKRVR